MTIEQTIQKAIDGGYIIHDFNKDLKIEDAINMLGFVEVVILDPLFWQALGKSMGWDKEHMFCSTYEQCKIENNWLIFQHKLIDHLADGETIESYFETL